MIIKYKILILVTVLCFIYSCKSESPVGPENNTPKNFLNVLTAESGNKKYELWKLSVNTLNNGYNVIGFKFYLNGAEVKDGYVKFFPMMYHGPGGPGHSSPVSEKFYYVDSTKLFTGYSIFLMISDSNNFWYGNFSHNDSDNVDSVFFNVNSSPDHQVLRWDDYSSYTYFLTLVSPLNATLGLNMFSIMLHRTSNDLNYYEVNDAEMFIRPWMLSHGHGSSNNINPRPLGNGLYTGQTNFTMVGEWAVYDSIKVNGNFITKSPPPYFYYIVR